MVTKFNDVDTKILSSSGLFTKKKVWFRKTVCFGKHWDVDKKIPNTRYLIKRTVYNTKVTEIENEIPNINGVDPTATINTKDTEIENKEPKISKLVVKTDHNTKIIEIIDISDILQIHLMDISEIMIEPKA